MEDRKLSYTIIPFVFIFLLLMLTYFGNQWYAEKMGIIGIDYSYIFLKFNQAVPFVDWTIYPYIIAYPFWAGTFFYVSYRSRKNMNIVMTITTITFIICGLWYFLFQSDVQAWRETSGLFDNHNLNFTESIVYMIYNAAGPRNALPSMHCLMSWICIIGVRLDKKMPIWPKIIIVTIAMSIIISTQTLKQHYIIDLIAGIALAELAFQILRHTKLPLYFGNVITKINKKFKLN